MTFKVFLTDDASLDLEDLYGYIETSDAPEKADYILDELEKVFASLSKNPARGACPRELQVVGLREYREVSFKPYRIIYRVIGENVYIMVIADGRRDMQTLLQRRLLRA